MSDFLDKLVMEVAEWGMVPTAIGAWRSKIDGEFVVLCDGGHSIITKSQWLQRRKELINEPDDSDAPKWANWKAQDSCGKWFWRDEKPTIGDGMWFDDGYWSGSNNGKIPAGHDWRTTLKETKRETKVCDNLHEDVKVSGVLEITNQNQLSDLCFLLDTTQDEWVKEVLRIVIARLICKQYGLDINEIINPVV